MVTAPARVALTVETDLVHGGRWTSLRADDREWLWHRHCPERSSVSPGREFADAGGLEECVPTIRGLPDHGDAWSRPWRARGDIAEVECPDFAMVRRLRTDSGSVVADYRLSADPGYRFLWAAHALLAVSPDARLEAPPGTPTRLHPEAAPLIDAPWPDGAPWLEGPWPAPRGLSLDRLGPDDGTAVGAVLAGCADVRVCDGPDTLRMRLAADGQPVSTALWRNLGGFPAEAPYRSIGVEPMLGAVFDLADARDGDAAVVPPSGELHWQLILTAERRHS